MASGSDAAFVVVKKRPPVSSAILWSSGARIAASKYSESPADTRTFIFAVPSVFTSRPASAVRVALTLTV